MPGHHYAVEGRSFIEVTHLALLGVKIVGPALWGYFYKREFDSICCKRKQALKNKRKRPNITKETDTGTLRLRLCPRYVKITFRLMEVTFKIKDTIKYKRYYKRRYMEKYSRQRTKDNKKTAEFKREVILKGMCTKQHLKR